MRSNKSRLLFCHDWIGCNCHAGNKLNIDNAKVSFECYFQKVKFLKRRQSDWWLLHRSLFSYFSEHDESGKDFLVLCFVLPYPAKPVLQPVWAIWRLLQTRSLQTIGAKGRLWFSIHSRKGLFRDMRITSISAGSPALLQEDVFML